MRPSQKGTVMYQGRLIILDLRRQTENNHCAIPYIIIVLVAFAAHRIKSDHKMRSVKSFVADFMTP